MMNVETCQLFENAAIDRALSLTDRYAIINHIISNGNP